MSINFDDVLSKKSSEVEKPKTKPAGHYLGATVGIPTPKTATVKGEEKTILEFKVKLMAPQDDVSQDALSEHPDISSWPPYRYDVWVEDDLWSLKRFLTDVLKVDPGPVDDAKTFKEMLAESAGHQAIFEGVHKPYTDKATGQPELALNLVSAVAA